MIWLQDFHNPFYVATRVGKNSNTFKMYKFRSMIVNADKSGVDSTSSDDNRITTIGKFIRKYKLDELSQLFNVFIGNMSLVGPRPNVLRETNLYSNKEKQILSVKPGITDLSSIVFADEGEILEGKESPDIAYNQLIRPYKSRLALVYVNNRSFLLDLKILFLTAFSFVDREKTLYKVSRIVFSLTEDKALAEVSLRKKPLLPKPPPGFDSIIQTRDLQ
jgi:lipopolysaccharide/colanic/teichoic acid biosynthesis glycosyltransferase